MLTVHHLQVSQSERIVWLCEELGIPYELKLYQRSPFFSPPELKALHPMGAAPVITDGPTTLAESAACVEYICRMHGDSRLMLPPSHPQYADFLYWFHFSNGNLQPTIIRSFTISRLSDVIPPEDPTSLNMKEKLERCLGFVDARLKETGKWLAGEEFTVADVMSVFSLTTMRCFAPLDLGPYPNILGYLKRVGDRKAYRDAMKKGDPDMEPSLKALPSMDFMKQAQSKA